MAKQLKVRYTIQSGSLPNGMSLDPDTGVITGSAGWDALGLGPTWTGPAAGSLGSFNENDPFSSTTFTATGKTPLNFSVVQGYIPWGLVFNPSTGVLSGTIAPLKQRVNETASNYDGPKWNTSFGTLANYDEGATSSLILSATPIGQRTMRGYQVIDGFLPWGLTLNMQTGVISGSTARLKNPGAYIDVPKLPVPAWTTTSGSLGTFDEYSTFSATLAATPAAGRSMAKYVINGGFLPFGLRLNQQTGAITGTFADMFVEEAGFVDAANAPTISNTVNIQGTDIVVNDGGTLGSYAKGTAVTINFAATAISGRTVRNYFVSSGSLPFGLKLNSLTGQISGTIINNVRTKSQDYTFTLQVYDKGDTQYRRNRVSRTYKITVQ